MRNTEKSMEELADEFREVAHVEDRRADLVRAEFLVRDLIELAYVSPQQQESALLARDEAWLQFEKAKTQNYLFYKEVQELDS